MANLKLAAAKFEQGVREGLTKKLVKASRSDTRKIKAILNNEKRFAKFCTHLKAEIADDGEDTILDKLDALITWILEHQEQIKAIIALVMTLFAV